MTHTHIYVCVNLKKKTHDSLYIFYRFGDRFMNFKKKIYMIPYIYFIHLIIDL